MCSHSTSTTIHIGLTQLRNRTTRAVEFMRVVADNALYNRKTKRDELFEDFLENGNPSGNHAPSPIYYQRW